MAIVLFAWTAMAQTQGFSVLLLPLTEQLDVTSRDLSLIFLVAAFGGAFLMPVAGRLFDHRGARRILILAVLAYALAFCVLALVHVKPLAIGALLTVRLIGSIVLWLGASVLVAWWFSRRRGFALGLLVGVGSALLSLLAYGLSVLIEHVGVTTSFLMLAVVSYAGLVPMLIWGVVDRPSDLGQHPDGEPFPAGAGNSESATGDLYGVTASVAYRTPFAWLITASGALAAVVTTGYLFHEAVIFIEQGATAHDAAASLLPQMAGNALAVLVVSTLVDRFQMRWIVSLAMAQVVATMWWGFHLELVGSLWLFGLSFGMATGVTFGYALAALPRYFGTKHVGEIRGMFGAITMAAASVGPLGFELLQEDRSAALIAAAALGAVVISVASLMIRWPQPMDRPSRLPAAGVG